MIPPSSGGLSRAGLEDRICYCQRELDNLKRIQQDTSCRTCWHYNDGNCRHYGKVPEDYVQKGCDDWEYDDIPF